MPAIISHSTAAVLHGPRDIRITERKIWPPSQGQVQVQIVTTGLCGSDRMSLLSPSLFSLTYFLVHYYMNARNGDFAVSQPLVLGHEAAGIVTAVGQGVKNFKIGDRVAIEAGIYCRACNFCDKGRYNLCRGMKFCSSAAVYPHVDGTLQAKMNHPAHVLHQYVSFSPSFRLSRLNQNHLACPTCAPSTKLPSQNPFQSSSTLLGGVTSPPLKPSLYMVLVPSVS